MRGNGRARRAAWIGIVSMLFVFAQVAQAEIRVSTGSKWGGGVSGPGHRSVSGYLYDTNRDVFSCGMFSGATGPAKMYCTVDTPGDVIGSIYCESENPEHVKAISAMTSTSGVYFEVLAGGGPGGNLMDRPGSVCSYVFVWNGKTEQWEIQANDPNLVPLP